MDLEKPWKLPGHYQEVSDVRDNIIALNYQL